MHDHDDADASEVSNDGSRPEDDVVDVQHFDKPVMEQAAQRSKADSQRCSSTSTGANLKRKPSGQVQGMCCRGAVGAWHKHLPSARGLWVACSEGTALPDRKPHEVSVLRMECTLCIHTLFGAALNGFSEKSLFFCATLQISKPSLCPSPFMPCTRSRRISFHRYCPYSGFLWHVLSWRQRAGHPRLAPVRRAAQSLPNHILRPCSAMLLVLWKGTVMMERVQASNCALSIDLVDASS
jgi:hypothetical protein